MPSSYSTNLLLKLMADGENDGLWGDITNTNLEILGRAISGSKTISLSGTTHTHTFSDTTSAAGAHSHSFSGTTSTEGAHNHTYYWSGISGSDNSPDVDSSTSSGSNSGPTSTAGAHNHTFSGTTSSVSNHTHSVSGTTSSAGDGSSHENRPPYYALAYIMKL